MAAFRHGEIRQSLVTMNYSEEITSAMTWLGEQQNTLFIGQTVKYPGTALFKTLNGIPESKRLELPVMEESQVGMSIGLSLNGFVPVSIFPRYNFLLLAVNQIVNHLDKYKEMSDGQYVPKVIIRTVQGSESPLYPGHQHVGSFSEAFRSMCKNIEVIDLYRAEDIFPAYQKAYNREDGKSTILVEIGDLLDKK